MVGRWLDGTSGCVYLACWLVACTPPLLPRVNRLHSCPANPPAPEPCTAPVPQNLEVLYRQYGRDGNKHGLDWQEVAVAIIQDGVGHCDSSVLAGSTVTVRGGGAGSPSACCSLLAHGPRPWPCRAFASVAWLPRFLSRVWPLFSAACLPVQGFYSENLQQEQAVGLPVSMHMFEYTARCSACPHPAFPCCLCPAAWLAGWRMQPQATLAPRLPGSQLTSLPLRCVSIMLSQPALPRSRPAAGTRSTRAWTATRRCKSCSPPRPPTGASWTRTAGSLTASPTCCSQTTACCLMRVSGGARRGEAARGARDPAGSRGMLNGRLPPCAALRCSQQCPHQPIAAPRRRLAAGTKPMPFALRNTYAHFKRNPWCGGLTGELRVERPYRNFLTSVQYMEWKVSDTWWCTAQRCLPPWRCLSRGCWLGRLCRSSAFFQACMPAMALYLCSTPQARLSPLVAEFQPAAPPLAPRRCPIC